MATLVSESLTIPSSGDLNQNRRTSAATRIARYDLSKTVHAASASAKGANRDSADAPELNKHLIADLAKSNMNLAAILNSIKISRLSSVQAGKNLRSDKSLSNDENLLTIGAVSDSGKREDLCEK